MSKKVVLQITFFHIWKQFPENVSVRQFHVVLSKICFLRTQNFYFWILPFTSNTEDWENPSLSFYQHTNGSALGESCLTEVAEVTITKLGSTSSYNDWIIKFTELWTKAKTEFLTPQISAIPGQNTTSFKHLLTIVFLSWKSHYWDSFFYCKTWIMPGHEQRTLG